MKTKLLTNKEADKTRRISLELADISNRINVLASLDWGAATSETFLSKIMNGERKLPDITFAEQDLSKERNDLVLIKNKIDTRNPLECLIDSAIDSYILAIGLIESRGKKSFLQISKDLYGDPSSPVIDGKLTALEAAQHFLAETASLADAALLKPSEVCIQPEVVAEQIQLAANKFFHSHSVEVLLDDTLSAKAAASSRRIRIRKFTCFSKLDAPQLMQHELFTHSLTKINGEEQPIFKLLGVGSPRTTCTQEGLALFAELITHAMDLSRLRRVSARVKAIQMGIDGADFFEVYDFFRSVGQNESESFHSARRVFRGGIVSGGTVFTKDAVYLRGFLDVHQFFHQELKNAATAAPELLFAGRLAIEDIPILKEFYLEGIISKPLYEPHWFQKREAVLAFLVYSAFCSDLGIN